MTSVASLLPARKPGFTECYRLGVTLSKELDPVCTYEQIAAAIGVTKQNAYTEVVLALGKLGFMLRQRLQSEVRHG